MKLLIKITFIAILIQSCSKIESTSSFFRMTEEEPELTFLNNLYQFSYTNEENLEYIGVFDSISNIKNLLTQFDFNTEISDSLATVFFIKNSPIQSDSINSNDIEAIIIYEKVQKHYNVKVFNRNGLEFNLTDLSNSRSNLISTNDVWSAYRVLYGTPTTDVTLIEVSASDTDLPNYDYGGLFQYKLGIKLHQLEVPSGDDCMIPCKVKTPDSYCAREDVGLGPLRSTYYNCKLLVTICITPEMHKKVLSETPQSTLDIYDITSTLYDFRDDYLFKHGGDEYVEMYYYLSSRFNVNKLSLGFVDSTYSLLTTIQPELEKLILTPFSNEDYPINSVLSIKLESYLEYIKDFFTDQTALDMIDILLQKVDIFTEADYEFVTTNL